MLHIVHSSNLFCLIRILLQSNTIKQSTQELITAHCQQYKLYHVYYQGAPTTILQNDSYVHYWPIIRQALQAPVVHLYNMRCCRWFYDNCGLELLNGIPHGGSRFLCLSPYYYNLIGARHFAGQSGCQRREARGKAAWPPPAHHRYHGALLLRLVHIVCKGIAPINMPRAPYHAAAK